MSATTSESAPISRSRARTALLRILRITGAVLAWILVWLSITLLVAAIGIQIFFGRISIDQLVLNLIAVPTDGGGLSGMILLAVLGIGVMPLLVTVLLAAWFHRRRYRLKRTERMTRLRRRLGRATAAVAMVSIVVCGTAAFRGIVKLDDYMAAGLSDADVGEYYDAPVITDDSGRRNIVVIYLESGEATLQDTSVFEKDPYESLLAATEGWTQIDDYRQYAGGGWTMAGIVSTQCGIPLKGMLAASGSGVILDIAYGLESYLPAETCFGDVLHEHGYRSEFIGGADGSFAAKDRFLSDHGYDAEQDLRTWHAEGEDESNMRSDWGLSDERLMDHARETVTRLHDDAERTGQPFNLSMLTLDTHEPVHPYDYCSVDTEQVMTSVYACSMDEVAGFVEYMDEQGYLDDTAVVIMGDHLKQLGGLSSFTPELQDRTDRTIFNRVWIPQQDASDPQPTMRSGVDQLSMYATLLQAAGLEVEDNEAGLGVSAFTHEIPDESALALPNEEYRELLHARSDEFYKRAWGKE